MDDISECLNDERTHRVLGHVQPVHLLVQVCAVVRGGGGGPGGQQGRGVGRGRVAGQGARVQAHLPSLMNNNMIFRQVSSNLMHN